MQDLLSQLMQNSKPEEEKNVISEKKNNKAYEKDLQAIREEFLVFLLLMTISQTLTLKR